MCQVHGLYDDRLFDNSLGGGGLGQLLANAKDLCPSLFQGNETDMESLLSTLTQRRRTGTVLTNIENVNQRPKNVF